MKSYQKYLLTGSIVLVAVAFIYLKYSRFLTNPWTRDGQVRAEVIQIAPRVSGPIVTLPIKDNQFVKAGDLLFEIDPRTFRASFEQAKAQLDNIRNNYVALEEKLEAARAQVEVSKAAVLKEMSSIKELDSMIEKNESEYERQKEMLPHKATSQKSLERAKANYAVSLEKRKGAVVSLSQAKSSLRQAEAALAEANANLGEPGEANASIRSAKANVEQARLNLEFTKVKASTDGFITNLNLRVGSQAVANQPVLALIDTNSFWVNGFFKENLIGNISPGNKAIITLMTYPDTPIEGYVDSLGWGIAQNNGSPGFDLLPSVSPTFEWIRLAQRIPVRIHMTTVPESVKLRVGTTASVLVQTNTNHSGFQE
jgi:multidrug resistance efflux pump